ncbi:hypothetical protein JTB14_003932 [Gonioctena quinquepunctata]|nr:hypothetical protein JTB14_003932 [Gonioctena quinquepunctata]
MDNILVVEDSCEILNESSEESSDKEESSGKENKTENENNSCNLSEPSASTSKSNNPNTILLRDFLSIFKETIKGTKFESLENKIPSLKKYYDKYEEDQGESIDFKQVIEASIAKATQSTGKAVVGFKDIYEYLQEISSADSVEVTAEDRIKLKKLGRTIKLLVSKIKQLEEAEINFDDEEDSTYLQLDRYTRRLNLVHQKYCVLLERNPYSGRLTYSKLDFSDSNYNEINRAISKKFKNNKKFPSYFEMKNFIEKVAEENNLELSEPIIKAESVHCFTKLGELLQNRRRRELYDSHYTLIKDNEDPAKDDPSLNSILQKQYSEGQSKVEKLVQEYVKKQEYGVGSDSTGLEADSTGDDSDKSDNVDSNSEDKDTIDSET